MQTQTTPGWRVSPPRLLLSIQRWSARCQCSVVSACTVPAFTFPLNLFPARHKNNGHLLFTAEVIKRWSSFLTFSAAVLYVRGILRPRVTVTLCKVRQTGHIVTACQSEEIKFRIYPGLFYDQLKESIKRYLNPIINEIILSIQIWQVCSVETWTSRHDRYQI